MKLHKYCLNIKQNNIKNPKLLKTKAIITVKNNISPITLSLKQLKSSFKKITIINL